MNPKNTITMLAITLAVFTFIAGCKKKEQPAPQSSMEGMSHQAEANDAAQAQLASIEQKTCPVTGQPIDPAVSIEYKGKKVYFCCSMCIAKFNKEPEKYIAKLPQFSK